MRILWHAAAPWTPTGYGQQSALFLPRLRDLGHEVFVSAVNQHLGSPLMWEGFEVYSAGQVPYGADVLPGYAADLKPDLLITLTEAWKLDRDVIRALPCPTACWAPADTDKIAYGDKVFFASSGARPVAMTRHGEQLLAAFRPLYVPHGVDTAVFQPPEDRQAIRDLLKIPENFFAAGICAMNKGIPSRKAFYEQMAGFAVFRRKHPESLLFLHTQAASPDGLNLIHIAQELGILDACRFTSPHRMVTGQVDPGELAGWYGAMDVVLMATMGEGFGVPAIEAMACGTPVIAARAGGVSELVTPAAGWHVGGLPFWNPVHRACWLLPDYREIARALGKALESRGRKREDARGRALHYDAGLITRDYWKPVLEELEAAAGEHQAGVPGDGAEGVLGPPPGWLARPPEDAELLA